MFDDKTQNKIDKIAEFFADSGYSFLKEDLIEFFHERPDVLDKIKEMKFNKIEFFTSPETDSVGFTLQDAQIEFFVERGEDEEGPWYEATAEILDFSGEE